MGIGEAEFSLNEGLESYQMNSWGKHNSLYLQGSCTDYMMATSTLYVSEPCFLGTRKDRNLLRYL